MRAAAVGGGVGIPLGIGGVVVLLIGSWLTGVNLFDVVDTGGGATDVVAERPASTSPEEEQLVDFVDAVTGDIQHTWSQKIGNYQPTRGLRHQKHALDTRRQRQRRGCARRGGGGGWACRSGSAASSCCWWARG